MRRPIWLLLLFVTTLSWSAAIAAAPTTTTAPRLAAFTYAAGALICHQRADRSFRAGDAQYPVCARCQGLYLGACAGVLLWMGISGIGRTPRANAARIATSDVVRRVLIVTAIPTLLTVLSAWLGWWDAANVVRAALALPLGAAIAATIAAVAAGDLR